MMLYPEDSRYLMRNTRFETSWSHSYRHCVMCFSGSFGLALQYVLDQAQLHNPFGIDGLAFKALLSGSQNSRGFMDFSGHPSSNCNIY